MRKFALFLSSLVLTTLLINVVRPCSDFYIAPVFQYKYAPENPFGNFANGKIGIIKPTYRRVVLYAAYRYLNNQGFSADEQKALVQVWNAEFRNEEPHESNTREIAKKWFEKRKEIIKDEENPQQTNAERQFDSYSFFPNCSENAFETAIETLSARIFEHGAEDKNVAEWLKGQDTVFKNCESGRNIPSLSPNFPEWLKKDRQYQIGAAEFYAMNFEEAKKKFAEIALDADSVWQETAEYLVGRTLLRQASFMKDERERRKLYEEAELRLTTLRGTKYYDSAQKLVNLIKIKIRPAERTQELSQSLLFQQYGDRLRQDLIDYTWLLDKFETEILRMEEKRKHEESDGILRETILANLAAIGVSIEVKVEKGEAILDGKVNADQYEQILSAVKKANPKKITDNLTRITQNTDGSITSQGGSYYDQETRDKWEAIRRGELLEIELYEPSYRRFFVKPEMSDDEILEFIINGQNLSEEETKKISEAIKLSRAKQTSQKFYSKPESDYEGGYSGDELLSNALLPQFLRDDDLTDWLFTFQIQDENAYLHSYDKWRQNNSDLWLMTAITKAKKNSINLKVLLEAAGKINRSSPAFPTVSYHIARIYIEQEKQMEARKLLDEILASNLDLPISSRNLFIEMRMKIATGLDEFLRNSRRVPFTFSDSGWSVTIDEVIEGQKSWWRSDYRMSKAEWDKQTEERFSEHKLWEKREMFDAETVKIINENFPLEVFLEAQKSSELPDYLRKKLAIVIWTRAFLVGNES
ncbi:MAG TPA: BON domain-containing protein, partial [Pyrinomonadaceae bacterium]|nr:BON domain-containing protein [Pyrinomonadaceae bacterium]